MNHLEYENPSINVSDFIGLSSDEVIIKAFKEIELQGPKGHGYFIVTNHRLIYMLDAKEQFYNFVSLAEYDIKSISSIKSIYGKVANLVARVLGYTFLIIGIIGIFSGLSTLIADNFLTTYKEILLIGGGSLVVLSILLFIFGKNKVFSIEIKTNNNLNSEIKLSSSYFRPPFSKQITASVSKESFYLIQNLGKSIYEARNYQAESKPKKVKPQEGEFVELKDHFVNNQSPEIIPKITPQEEKQKEEPSEDIIEIEEIF